MQYEDLQSKVARLDFIDEAEEADAAIKAVLGIMTSCLDQQRARELAKLLPAPLDYDTLRGHQQNIPQVSFDDFLGQLSNQFKISDSESRRLVETVVRRTREGIGDQAFKHICQGLPQDWQRNLGRY